MFKLYIKNKLCPTHISMGHNHWNMYIEDTNNFWYCWTIEEYKALYKP